MLTTCLAQRIEMIISRLNTQIVSNLANSVYITSIIFFPLSTIIHVLSSNNNSTSRQQLAIHKQK